MLDIVDPVSTAVQRLLRRTGLAGYEPATMATLLAAFQRQRPGFHFVDVGANMGLYSAICAVMFEPGRVVAFEPTPDVAEVARRVLAANGISVERRTSRAVRPRRTSGTVPLYLSAVSDSSNSLVAGFKQSVGSIDVAVTTLDDYVAATGTTPDIVKIDTETFEPAVIRALGRLCNGSAHGSSSRCCTAAGMTMASRCRRRWTGSAIRTTGCRRSTDWTSEYQRSQASRVARRLTGCSLHSRSTAPFGDDVRRWHRAVGRLHG